MRIVKRHHALVRVSHWLNVPILAGMTMSGLSIYWASPVYKGFSQGVYTSLGLGTGNLAAALRLHWLFAYLFMANGVLYGLGLVAAGGWRALLPAPSDAREAFAMLRYYVGVVPMRLRGRVWTEPPLTRKYNALQRGAYLSMPVAGALSILSGWAMHKPVQLHLLERLFGSYAGARVWHFWLMVFFALFLVPHVVLVAADGWDTFRSMISGWSQRVREAVTEIVPETVPALPKVLPEVLPEVPPEAQTEAPLETPSETDQETRR